MVQSTGKEEPPTHISSLKLHDYRNYQKLDLVPHPGVNILLGHNGAGKTNLLEAIHYCALGRSHRTNLDREVIRKGQDMAAVGLTVNRRLGREDIALKLLPVKDHRKQVFLNRKRVQRISDLMGHFQCVIFSPEDLQLVKEGPGTRRRFLDMLISQMDPSYFLALQQYQKGLEQRNALLREARKENKRNDALLDVFEQAMANAAAVIIPRRSQIMTSLSALGEEKYAAISGRPEEPFRLHYDCCLAQQENVAIQLVALLKARRQEDTLRGLTSVGVHREDILLTLMDRDMRLFASQGQIRTAALSMKLAQMALFTNSMGESPVLLLDDVMSELDMTRRTRLLEEIRQVQTFITCTDATDLQGCLNQRSYEVTNVEGLATVRPVADGEEVLIEDVDMSELGG